MKGGGVGFNIERGGGGGEKTGGRGGQKMK